MKMNDATRIWTAVMTLTWLLSAGPLAAAPIGTDRQTVDVNGTPMVVFTYRPAGCPEPSLLVVFHGIARNAQSYRDYTRVLADRLCLLVAAPVFEEQAFPGWRYQRGGIVKNAAVQDARDWTGRLVLDLVAWVRRQEERPLAYSLLGHSAGGQFLDRLAAFVPTEARRIVVANAGSYVFPSLEIAAPYGLGKVYSEADGEAALRRYLEQPLTIYLGQGDTRDDERNDYALAQGNSRYQRGINVFNAGKMLAQ
jgi:poly(3-hydroxybutyrate) depolymerase